VRGPGAHAPVHVLENLAQHRDLLDVVQPLPVRAAARNDETVAALPASEGAGRNAELTRDGADLERHRGQRLFHVRAHESRNTPLGPLPNRRSSRIDRLLTSLAQPLCNPTR